MYNNDREWSELKKQRSIDNENQETDAPNPIQSRMPLTKILKLYLETGKQRKNKVEANNSRLLYLCSLWKKKKVKWKGGK